MDLKVYIKNERFYKLKQSKYDYYSKLLEKESRNKETEVVVVKDGNNIELIAQIRLTQLNIPY